MPGALVSADWLAAHLDDVRVVDVRWYLNGPSGRDAYAAGHIPGAVWLDIDTELSDPATPADGRHPLPSPERFAAALGRAGIAAGTPVVAYDDAGGSTAARLWWLLHVLDEPVAVLDGGLAAWPGELTDGCPDTSAGAARGAPVAGAPVSCPPTTWLPATRRPRCPQRAAVCGGRPGDRPAAGPHPRRAQRALAGQPRRHRAASARPPSCASGSPISATARWSPTAVPA